MASCIVEKTDSFTLIKNVALRDKRLRHSTRGLLAFMLSLPPDWDMTIEGLASISVECSDTISRMITELEQAGYVVRQRERREDGTLGEMKYYVFQKPLHNKPIRKKPVLVKPVQEKSGQINTDITNKEEINTDSSNILSINQIDEMDKFRNIIYLNIDYEFLSQSNDRKIVDELVENMLECVCSTAKTILIGKEEVSQEVVKSRMLKLDSFHIEYVIDCLRKNTKKVRNIKSYIRTMLFNAPTTIDSYYTAEVAHDLNRTD